MHEFANERDSVRRGAVEVPADWFQRRIAESCLAVALSPAFAWMRPFTLDDQTFFVRLGYWSGMLVSWFAVMAITALLLGRLAAFRLARPLARKSAIIGLAALPMMLIAGPATNALSGWEASVDEVVELYWQIVVLGSLVALIAHAVLPGVIRTDRADTSPSTSSVVPAAREMVSHEEHQPAASPLIARLPLAIRGRIICLEMEDHYVRVHTDHGSALVLMRLSDAMTESHPLRGQQVHRSWWVNGDAVEGFERVRRGGALLLSNGLRAPVSQRYLRSVQTSFSETVQSRKPCSNPREV